MAVVEEWVARAVCYPAAVDPDLFFERGPQRAALALAHCARCPVADACLDAAVAGAEVGVWGGTTWEQRERGAGIGDPALAARIADAWARSRRIRQAPRHGTLLRYRTGCTDGPAGGACDGSALAGPLRDLHLPAIRAWHGTLCPGGQECLRLYEDAVAALGHADHVLTVALRDVWLHYRPWVRGGPRPRPDGIHTGVHCLIGGLDQVRRRLRFALASPTDLGLDAVFGDRVHVACQAIAHGRRTLDEASDLSSDLRSRR